MAKSKARKWIKRILIGFGIFLVLFVVAAITLPMLFKKQIMEAAKKTINEQLTATVDFKDASLSLIWTFPNFSFNLKGLTVTGKKEFEGLKLADVKEVSLRLNLWKVISGDYEVNAFVLDQPKLYIKVLNNGKANYDIMKPDTSKTTTSSSESTEFKARLRYYAIKNGDIIYDDAPSKTYVSIVNLNHNGSGDLTSNTYDFFTKTNMDEFTVSYDRIRYFNKTKVEIRLNIGVDMAKMAFKLLDNSFKFNALELKADGGIEMPGNDIKFNNLKFQAPTTSFAAVLSMIPSAFTKDFANVKTKGTFSLSGSVNGTYNEKSYPAFNVNLKVGNAEFQYPDLPMAVTNINTDIAVNSPSSNLDNMSVNVSKFTMKLGNNPFEATLKLTTPMSDPNVDAKVKGKIDLAELAKAFPMEGVTSMAGIIEANLEAKTRMSYIEKQAYDKVDMKGMLAISKFTYIAKGMPNVQIRNMKMDFTPNNVNLEDFDVLIGKSDIKASGKLDNILTYFSRDKIMMGNLTVKSNLLDLNEMMGTSAADTTAKSDPKSATNMVDTTSAPAQEGVFDRWDFAADFQCKKMVYDVYEIKDMAAKGTFSRSRAKLDNFEMMIGKVDLQANGQLDNVFGYLFDNQEIKGELNISSNYMNLNQFMTESGQATEPAPPATPANPETVKSEYEPIIVPANINFRMTAAFATLIYESYKLKNVKGDLRIRDQKVEIINLSFNAFGGSLALNGEYNSKNEKAPTFAFGYDVQKLDFQEVAQGVPFVTYMAPALKSLFGKFSSQFKMNGVLGENLYPKLGTLNAEGLLQTFDATLKGLTPMKGLSDKLKLKELENIVITNTTNFFKIENGKFIIKPFAFKHSDIDMTFGGSHSLDQKMDYNLKMRIPKKLLDKAGVGQAASAGMQALSGQASKLGIKVEEAEFLNVGVDIGGTTTKPTFTPKLLGAEGKSGNSLGDQVKESVKEEAQKLKDEAEAKVREEAEKVRAEAEARARAEAERATKELEARAKAEADRLAKQAKDNVEAKRLRDSIEAATKAAKEKLLKDKLKDIPNPFKKNK